MSRFLVSIGVRSAIWIPPIPRKATGGVASVAGRALLHEPAVAVGIAEGEEGVPVPAPPRAPGAALVVEDEAALLAVEALRPVHVRDGDDHEFELPLHLVSSSHSAAQGFVYASV